MTRTLVSLVFWCDAIALCEEHAKNCVAAIGDNSQIFKHIQFENGVLKAQRARFDDSDARCLGFSHVVNYCNVASLIKWMWKWWIFLVNKWLKYQSVCLQKTRNIVRWTNSEVLCLFFFGDWQHIHTHLLLLNLNTQSFCQTSTFVLCKRKRVKRLGATCVSKWNRMFFL